MKHQTIIRLILLPLILGIWNCGIQKAPAAKTPLAQVKPNSIRNIALDQLGQLYTVSNNNEIIQYQSDGIERFRYNNNTLGKLDLIDPTNPFTILLYYPDFQTIVLLDRTLSEQARIQLSTLNLLDIKLVSLSNDNFIWLYDAVDSQLKKLDKSGNISFQSDRFDLFLQEKPNPVQLLAPHNRLFLNDPETGIFIFDQYGRYETTLPILAAESLQMIDDFTLVYLRAGEIFGYDLRSLQEKPLGLKIPCVSDCQMRIGKGTVFWLKKGEIEKMTLPGKP